MYKTEIWACP